MHDRCDERSGERLSASLASPAMGFRDRFFTAKTARAILSWRILAGIASTVVLGVLGVNLVVALLAGVAVYTGLVLLGMPRQRTRPPLDPFTVGEPWRQFVHATQRSGTRLRETIGGVGAGPLHDKLATIGEKLDQALADTWEIARRGDEIDDTIRRLDPPALRSRLDTMRSRNAGEPAGELEAAITSLEGQLATAERLRQLSERAQGRLRLTQVRVDELVARASEIAVGAGDTDEYAHDVDDLLVELESLRLAVEETRDS